MPWLTRDADKINPSFVRVVDQFFGISRLSVPTYREVDSRLASEDVSNRTGAIQHQVGRRAVFMDLISLACE